MRTEQRDRHAAWGVGRARGFSGDHHGTVSHEALIFWGVWARGPWRAPNIRGRHLKERAQTRTSGVGLRGSEPDAQQQQALEQRVRSPLLLGPAEARHRDVGAEKALCGRQAHHQPVRSISVASDVRAGRRFVPVSFPFSSRDPQCDTLVLPRSTNVTLSSALCRETPRLTAQYLGTSLFSNVFRVFGKRNQERYI